MNHPQLTIHPMRRRHIPGILAIENQSFSQPWTEAMFLQELEDVAFSKSFVALQGRELAGYIISWFLRFEVHVLNIAVAPGARHRGVGRALMEFVVDRARSGSKELVTLEVRPSNSVAKQLYESMGFVGCAVRHGYYTETGEDALVMVLVLNRSAVQGERVLHETRRQDRRTHEIPLAKRSEATDVRMKSTPGRLADEDDDA